MTEQILKNRKIAILATDGFERSELIKPKEALERAGADVQIVALKTGAIRSWDKKDWGDTVEVDLIVSETTADDFDALMLPGGVMSPDSLRINEEAVQFVRGFVLDSKPIAAICHGPWTLIEAGAVQGKRMTSWPSLKSDLENAGAEWIDAEVVTDNGLITSRKPEDLAAFNKKMIEAFAEGPYEASQALRGAFEESRLR